MFRGPELYEYRALVTRCGLLLLKSLEHPQTQRPFMSGGNEARSNDSCWFYSPLCCPSEKFLLLLTACVSLITGPLS